MYRKARGHAIVRHNELSFPTCTMTSTNQLSAEEIITATLSWQLLSEFRTAFPAGMDADGFSLEF